MWDAINFLMHVIILLSVLGKDVLVECPTTDILPVHPTLYLWSYRNIEEKINIVMVTL